MPHGRLISIPAQGVCSLVWQGDTLVDWASGGTHYYLDGRTESRSCSPSYLFDAAVATADGEYSVIYTRLATKGLVLKDGEIVREINRSFYQAHAYDYPVAAFRLPNGRAVIAHCPNGYSCIDIEDIETGECLTLGTRREPVDIFHSRLHASTDGRWLVSAGWVWHPIDCVTVFDVQQALSAPEHLDSRGLLSGQYAEASSTAFDADGRLMIALEGDIDEERPLNEIRRFDLEQKDASNAFPVKQTIGLFMPIDEHHVLGLNSYPHLIDLRTGEIVERWPNISSSNAMTPLTGFRGIKSPAIAMDVNRRRLAIAGEDKIFVLDFS